MKLIFVSHPLTSSGTIQSNRAKADAICKEIVRMGHLPISPLHLFGFLQEETKEQRRPIMNTCFHLIPMCNEVWAYGDQGGCRDEIIHAHLVGVPVVMKGGKHQHEQLGI